MAAQRGFLACTQHLGQSPASYRDNLLRSWAVTLTQQGGSIAANYRLIPATNSDGNLRTKDDRRAKAYDKALAIALVTGADCSKYGTLIDKLSNQYASRRAEYPEDETGAYNNLLVNYKTPENVARPRNASQHSPQKRRRLRLQPAAV